MAEAKHTPGPWLADGASVYEERDDFSVICNFWSSSLPEWEANARLIAAAPDLLEALEQLVIEYDDVELANAEPSSLTAAFNAARAAIAKAKGEA